MTLVLSETFYSMSLLGTSLSIALGNETLSSPCIAPDLSPYQHPAGTVTSAEWVVCGGSGKNELT